MHSYQSDLGRSFALLVPWRYHVMQRTWQLESLIKVSSWARIDVVYRSESHLQRGIHLTHAEPQSHGSIQQAPEHYDEDTHS